MDTTIQLTDNDYNALALAIAERQLFLIQIKEQISTFDKAVTSAATAAGLDPAKDYTLDKSTKTATLKE